MNPGAVVASPFHTPLWSRRDATWLAAAVGAASAVIAASWFFAAGRPDAGDQLIFVSLSLLGAAIGMYATFIWLSHGRRTVGARTRLLLGAAPSAALDEPSSVEFVAGPDAKWFHRSDCLLVEGRAWPAASRRQHESAGRLPCRACKP